MRRGLLSFLPFVVVFVVALASASFVQAAKQHMEGEAKPGEPTAVGAAGSGEHGPAGGKSRSSFENMALDLTVWTIVVFFLLVLVLGRFAWKPMLEGLQKREQAIESAIAQAKKDQEEAAALRSQLQTELAKANDQMRTLMEQARLDGQATKDRMVAEARSEIQAERERAQREIESAREQAVRDLWEQTAELATLVSAKAIRRNMTLDDHRSLVDEAVAELNMTANGQSIA